MVSSDTHEESDKGEEDAGRQIKDSTLHLTRHPQLYRSTVQVQEHVDGHQNQLQPRTRKPGLPVG